MRKDKIQNLIKIVKCLKHSEEGWLWIREIARRTKLHHKTVSRLINTHLTMFVEIQKFEPFNVQMVRLKPGTDINGIFRFLTVMDKLNSDKK
ncbi:MAG: helix-turn-helix domain-containing protein [Candidatus Aenigmatarchaeota archaeon]